MGATPRFTFETLGREVRGQNLANASMERFASSGDFADTAYMIHGETAEIPGTWPANTPIKSGSIVCSRAGATVTGFVSLTFKSATLWSGSIFFTLPFALDAVFGEWEAIDASGGPAYLGGRFVLLRPSTGPYLGIGALGMSYRTANPGTLNKVSASAPWAWAHNDRVYGGFAARVAPGS